MEEKPSSGSTEKTAKEESPDGIDLDGEITTELRESQVLNEGESDEFTAEGYTIIWPLFVLAIILCILTAGTLALIFYWMQHWFLKLTHKKCPLINATKILILAKYNVKEVTSVYIMDIGSRSTTKATATHNNQLQPVVDGDAIKQKSDWNNASWTSLRFFRQQELLYYWDDEQKKFERLWGPDKETPSALFYQLQGWTTFDQDLRRYVYGRNFIEVEITPIFVLLIREVFSPFYIFQIFSICLWIAEAYYYYAGCIIFVTLVSITVTLVQTRLMQLKIRSRIDAVTSINVLVRDKELVSVHSDTLVLGDIIEIPRGGFTMQCDAVILSGNVIVNESMLTGESVPVTKIPLPNAVTDGQTSPIYDVKQHSRHTLFCGTKILQARLQEGQWVRAVVVRTGYSTMKGELIRSILYPKPVDFHFTRHSYGYIGVLAGLACCGFIYTVIRMMHFGAADKEIVIKTLDLITIAVPPLLPAVMTFGVMYAQFRLRARHIYCIAPARINVAGCVNVCVFDKTGTLTEDGLDMSDVVPTQDGKFLPAVQNSADIHSEAVLAGMAACHSLTCIDGVLSGDTLDLKMYEWTKWQLDECFDKPETNPFVELPPTIVYPVGNAANPCGVIRQLPFASKLQRMSVVTRMLNDSTFTLFAKGAPELIASLCKEGVPADFTKILQQYTRKGFRVVALASRSLEIKFSAIEHEARENLEKDLTFLGLIVMENRLKKCTTAEIEKLTKANIRIVMCTGDNIQTGMCVARDCKILPVGQKAYLLDVEEDRLTMKMVDGSEDSGSSGDHIVQISEQFVYAVTGAAFDVIRRTDEVALKKLCLRGAVFARMSPEQKQLLIEGIQGLGFIVGMCGDGANDCGALKAAHMGIALTETDASVASPFTSRDAEITCVPTVIKEGRAAMVTSFGLFKYMACYSLTQLIGVVILYWLGQSLTDLEFLYQDLFITTILVLFAGNTAACDELAPYPPSTSLLDSRPLLSLIVQTALAAIGQVVAFIVVQQMPGFVPFVYDPEAEDSSNQSHSNTAVFSVSVFMLITQVYIFAKGPPFRRMIFTNWIFMVYLILALFFSIWLVIYPVQTLIDGFELALIEDWRYRFVFLGIALCHLVLSVITEDFLIENLFWNKICACCRPRLFNKEVPPLEDTMNTKGPHLGDEIQWITTDPQATVKRPLEGITNPAFIDDYATQKQHKLSDNNNSDNSNNNDSSKDNGKDSGNNSGIDSSKDDNDIKN